MARCTHYSSLPGDLKPSHQKPLILHSCSWGSISTPLARFCRSRSPIKRVDFSVKLRPCPHECCSMSSSSQACAHFCNTQGVVWGKSAGTSRKIVCSLLALGFELRSQFPSDGVVGTPQQTPSHRNLHRVQCKSVAALFSAPKSPRFV